MKRIVRVVTAADARAGGGLTGIVRGILEALAPIPEAGVRLTVEVITPGDQTVLEQVEQAKVVMDFAQKGVFNYTCFCEWETQDVVALVEHLAKHGARRLAVVPQNWIPK